MWVERGTDLTGENFVRRLGSVVETRRRTRRSVKTRIHNPEHRIQRTKRSLEPIWGREGAERGENPIAAKERMERRAKRAKRSLEPRWGGAERDDRSPGTGTEMGAAGKRRESGSPEVGKGGKAEMKVDDYFPPFPGISGHFPPFPTFSHFIFILWPSGAWNQGGEMRSPDTGHRGAPGGAWEKLGTEWNPSLPRGGGCGVLRKKVRVVARKSAKVHESSHRSGPWLRDVTHCYGGDSFFG